LPAPRMAGCGLALFSTPWRCSLAQRVRGLSSLGTPAPPAAGDSLRSKTPSTATQKRVPCRGPSVSPALRDHRHPVPVRALGPRALGSHGRSHPLGGLNIPHPTCARACPRGCRPSMAEQTVQAHRERKGGGEIRPAGGRSHCDGACGHRAGVQRWGVAGAVSSEQRGALPRDVPARSHAKAGRRAALDAQPERPLRARGAKKNQPRSERRAGHAPAGHNKGIAQ